MELNVEKIVSGIVVGLTELALEEIKDRVKKRNNSKRRKSRKKKS